MRFLKPEGGGLRLRQGPRAAAAEQFKAPDMADPAAAMAGLADAAAAGGASSKVEEVDDDDEADETVRPPPPLSFGVESARQPARRSKGASLSHYPTFQLSRISRTVCLSHRTAFQRFLIAHTFCPASHISRLPGALG
jgi:hypothetical protein